MKLLATLLFFFILFSPGYSQDTINVSETLRNEIKSVNLKINEFEEKLETQVPKVEEPCPSCSEKLDLIWFYILMPVILSLVVGLYFLSWLRKEGFKISDALSTDVPEDRLNQFQADMVQPALNAGLKQTSIPSPPVNRSSSRLLAFLTSLSSVILAVCVFSYSMYFGISGKPSPEFDDLWTILAALGLGIVPYVTKVINEKEEK